MHLEIGVQAPHFSALADDGRIVKSEEFADKNIILYFYPKDETPGCTQEANDFKENFHKFQQLNTVIIGISKDNVKSHHNFKTRYDLPFILLADASLEIIKSYGAWVEKSMFGKKYMGIERCTVLIDTNDVVQQIWKNVKVKYHVKEVLDFVRNFNSTDAN